MLKRSLAIVIALVLAFSAFSMTTLVFADGAKTYTVTFDVRKGTPEIDSKIVEDGAQVEEPAAPTRADFVFVGWYDNKTNRPFFFGTAVHNDVTLYARWAKEGTDPGNLAYDYMNIFNRFFSLLMKFWEINILNPIFYMFHWEMTDKT